MMAMTTKSSISVKPKGLARAESFITAPGYKGKIMPKGACGVAYLPTLFLLAKPQADVGIIISPGELRRKAKIGFILRQPPSLVLAMAWAGLGGTLRTPSGN